MTQPTQQFFAIAATMHERGEAHSRYRAELVFCFAEDADAALVALRSQVASMRPGWEIVSTAIRLVPRLAETSDPGDPPCT
jgi:hypothetical protein